MPKTELLFSPSSNLLLVSIPQLNVCYHRSPSCSIRKSSLSFLFPLSPISTPPSVRLPSICRDHPMFIFLQLWSYSPRLRHRHLSSAVLQWTPIWWLYLDVCTHKILLPTAATVFFWKCKGQEIISLFKAYDYLLMTLEIQSKHHNLTFIILLQIISSV